MCAKVNEEETLVNFENKISCRDPFMRSVYSYNREDGSNINHSKDHIMAFQIYAATIQILAPQPHLLRIFSPCTAH